MDENLRAVQGRVFEVIPPSILEPSCAGTCTPTELEASGET